MTVTARRKSFCYYHVTKYYHEIHATVDLDEFKSLTVIMDNSTRWNSTDASISRALKLQPQLQVFTQSHLQDLGDDVLTVEDWATLAQIHEVLQPFRVLTKQLEGLAKEHHHGSVWEVLPAIELQLSHMRA
jgi:hypothetical protein